MDLRGIQLEDRVSRLGRLLKAGDDALAAVDAALDVRVTALEAAPPPAPPAPPAPPLWVPSPSRAVIWEDFLSVDYHGSNYWTRYQAGAGAATGNDFSTADAFGVMLAYTGSTAAGYAHLALYLANFDPVLGGGAVTTAARCKTSHTVDGANEFWCNIGWGDSAVGADETDGIYWRLVIGPAAVTPYICVASGGARTQTPIIPPGGWAPTDYHEYRIVTAADGLSSEFFMDGVSYGTIDSTDPNYPIAGQRCGMKFGATKTVGTAQRELHCDYVGLKKDFTTSRAPWDA